MSLSPGRILSRRDDGIIVSMLFSLRLDGSVTDDNLNYKYGPFDGSYPFDGSFDVDCVVVVAHFSPPGLMQPLSVAH